MKNINPSSTPAWQQLQSHFEDIKDMHLRDAFRNDPSRAKELSLETDHFLVDLSKNRWDLTTKKHLVQLAKEAGLEEAISDYFSGKSINQTEGRAVLHTALRAQEPHRGTEQLWQQAQDSKQKMYAFVNDVLDGTIRAHDGQAFDTIVNIGIGGSDLGPVMIYESLQAYKNHMQLHFVSNVEGDHVQEVIKKINPARTLFVIVSKSFGTQETLSNAMTLRSWFEGQMGSAAVAQHFIAVSSNVDKAVDFGIDASNIFPMFDWVGGRFSLWSTVGMSVALGIGTTHFESLLLGANQMDQHFLQTDFENNIPVQLALLTIWYNNFFAAQSEAVIPYTQYLHRLPAYLQQAIMESNGKGVDRNGESVNYQTGNIVWGEPGTNSQHAFFQLMHQGTKMIPAHFIAFAKSQYGHKDHDYKLMANFVAQTEALMNGKTEAEVRADYAKSSLSKEEIDRLVPFKVFTGNRPTTTILIDELTPYTLGQLVAMYEHKIFTEGILWNIFSYDQWGVQLGKVLADAVLEDLVAGSTGDHDTSTQQIIKRFLEANS